MGPTLGDHVLKPDLLAPGNRLVSSGIEPGGDARIFSTTAYPHAAAVAQNTILSCPAPAWPPHDQRCRCTDADGRSDADPATVKARLMRSARKIDAEPTASGAGVLDIDAAIDETGIVLGDALSPLMARSDAGPVVLVEDTRNSGVTRPGAPPTCGRMRTCGRMPISGPTATSGPTPTCGPTPICGRMPILGRRLPLD